MGMANKVATGTGELAADSGKRPSSTLYVLIALATVGVAAIAYRIMSKGPKEHKPELIDRKDQNSNFTKQIAVEPGEEITDRNNDAEQSSPDDSICETGRSIRCHQGESCRLFNVNALVHRDHDESRRTH